MMAVDCKIWRGFDEFRPILSNRNSKIICKVLVLININVAYTTRKCYKL